MRSKAYPFKRVKGQHWLLRKWSFSSKRSCGGRVRLNSQEAMMGELRFSTQAQTAGSVWDSPSCSNLIVYTFMAKWQPWLMEESEWTSCQWSHCPGGNEWQRKLFKVLLIWGTWYFLTSLKRKYRFELSRGENGGVWLRSMAAEHPCSSSQAHQGDNLGGGRGDGPNCTAEGGKLEWQNGCRGFGRSNSETPELQSHFQNHAVLFFFNLWANA